MLFDFAAGWVSCLEAGAEGLGLKPSLTHTPLSKGHLLQLLSRLLRPLEAPSLIADQRSYFLPTLWVSITPFSLPQSLLHKLME